MSADVDRTAVEARRDLQTAREMRELARRKSAGVPRTETLQPFTDLVMRAEGRFVAALEALMGLPPATAEEAVLVEREACAKLVEQMRDVFEAPEIAAAIRARGAA